MWDERYQLSPTTKCSDRLLWPNSASVGYDSSNCILLIKVSHPLIGWEPCAAICATIQPAQKIRVITIRLEGRQSNRSTHVVWHEGSIQLLQLCVCNWGPRHKDGGHHWGCLHEDHCVSVWNPRLAGKLSLSCHPSCHHILAGGSPVTQHRKISAWLLELCVGRS